MPDHPTFITALEQITPAWLTAALRESGTLPTGRVLRVTPGPTAHAPMSNAVGSLTVEYESGTPGEPPSSLFFKNGRMPGEVSFHQHVAPLLPQALQVPCHYAAFENDLGQSNLLFADLQPTHHFPDTSADLTETDYLHLMSALADLHRAFWDHPALTTDGAIGAHELNLPVKRVLDAARQNFPQFATALGARLTPGLQRRYEKLLANLPQPRTALQHLTVVHGDVQPKNLALPRTAGHSLHLVDWSLWHINLPTYDLAYLLALHTPKPQRASLELTCLKAYHQQLGLATYPFEQLLEDYRQSILFHAIWPVFFQRFTPSASWLPLFENIMSACDDWDCDATLQG